MGLAVKECSAVHTTPFDYRTIVIVRANVSPSLRGTSTRSQPTGMCNCLENGGVRGSRAKRSPSPSKTALDKLSTWGPIATGIMSGATSDSLPLETTLTR